MQVAAKIEHIYSILRDLQNGKGACSTVDTALLALEELREPFLRENEDVMLKVDGLDSAIIGIGRQFTQQFFVYDYDKCVEVFMTRDDMSVEDATEWMEFNVVGAYMGPSTPAFVSVGDDFEQAFEIQAEISAAPRLRGGELPEEDE